MTDVCAIGKSGAGWYCWYCPAANGIWADQPDDPINKTNPVTTRNPARQNEFR
jgi:hypothetical protein